MNKLYEEQSVQDIADAIRRKNAEWVTPVPPDPKYTVSEMASQVNKSPNRLKYGGNYFGVISTYFGGHGIYNSVGVSGKHIDTSEETDMSHYFQDAVANGTEEYINLKDMDTSSALNMSYMFSISSSSFKNLHLGEKWDTSNVKDMSYMFNGAAYLHSDNWNSGVNWFPLNTWDTSNVTNMSYMFNNAMKYYGANLCTYIGDWDVSKVTNMSYMFANQNGSSSGAYTPLKIISLPNWTTSSLTDVNHMFSEGTALTSVDLSDWDATKITTASNMFYGCTTLTSIDLSGWTTSSLTNVSAMFGKCKVLAHLDIRNFDFSNVTSSSSMFGRISSEYVPANCEIIVKDQTAKDWINSNFSRMTNVVIAQ